MRAYLVLLSFCLFVACRKNAEESMTTISTLPANGLTYLALGDSYTIGEAVSLQEAFPFQLANALKGSGYALSTPKIIAKTGWTTSELQSAIRAENLSQKFDVVTLLIGVNNQYRGAPITTYRKEFKELLQTALSFANGDKRKVFVVSIPDWGVTPFALNSGRSVAQISTEIDLFNAVNKEETLALGISYTDITPESRNALTDLSLLANDGLHPSGKMYAVWAGKLAAAMRISQQ